MNAITTTGGGSMLMDPQWFEQAQRVGGMLALSPLFPEHLRKGDKAQAIANAVLVLNMAARLREDPLTVASNIYFVGGKPGWATAYLISKANMHGVFKNPIDWDVTGSGDDLSVTAYAEMKGTGKRVQITCDFGMAKAEGWTKNPKYRSMPEQMLRYRSAAFLIRLYCPEVMIGVPAAVEVELETMRDVTPVDQSPEPAAVIDAETVEKHAPKASPKPRQRRDPTPYVDMAAKDKEEVQEAEEAPAEDKAKPAPDREQYEALASTIKNDLMDADAAEVAELYAAQIDQMKEDFPDLHEEVQGEIDAALKYQQQ